MREGQMVETDFAGKPVCHVNSDECDKALVAAVEQKPVNLLRRRLDEMH